LSKFFKPLVTVVVAVRGIVVVVVVAVVDN